jgi:hypothetical protein
MKAIIENYLYGDVAVPERTEDCYAYPEIREKFKSLLTEGTEEAPAARKRPGSTTPPAPPARVVEEAPVEAPVRGRTAASAPAAEAPARGRFASPTAAGRPAAGGKRPGRNVADDLRDV